MKPVSKQVQWVHDTKKTLRAERHNPTEGLYKAVLRPAGVGPSRPTTVSIWCCRCKEKTKLRSLKANDRGNIYVDNNARWTLGTSRPLYVARDSLCDHCGGGRLVPIDLSIPFIHIQQLTNFMSSFGNYDHVVIAALLDDWPSSSKEPRTRKESGDDVED